MDSQQEVTQTRGWEYKNRTFIRGRSILKRSVLLHPVLSLAFEKEEDAVIASKQHVCVCRNEDILLPESEIIVMEEDQFSQLPGFELRFGNSEQSFLVGYNRFDDNSPMFGWIEFNGQSLL